jgi:hypothetical protein
VNANNTAVNAAKVEEGKKNFIGSGFQAKIDVFCIQIRNFAQRKK